MIDGVTILREWVKEPSLALMISGVVTVIALVAFAFWLTVVHYITEFGFDLFIGVISVILLIVAVGANVLIITSYVNSKPVTRYEVTIDDSVSYNEFNRKYKVITKKDDIYTVELIEDIN